MPRRRIAVIGPARTPIAEPFSGGLAAHVSTLCVNLIERGHDVTLFAAPGSDRRLPLEEIAIDSLKLSDQARNDVSMPPEQTMREHHAYLSLMLRLANEPRRFDAVHNHSLHHLPIAMAHMIGTPMITTLHTPPTPWLESAVQAAPQPPPVRFAAVSEYTSAQWESLLGEVAVIANGIDLSRWPVGPGGPALVWTGRIAPEKAPHLAVEAARLARRSIVLAGPVVDPGYFRTVLAPLLDSTATGSATSSASGSATYVGHLDQRELSHLLRRSAVALVTPMWDEPYGLVVAEALASGTPVAGFRRGGIPEVVDDRCGRLVQGADVHALADAILAAERLPRRRARSRAEQHCSLDVMVDKYEMLLDETMAAWVAA